jgi:hypothetical protein
MYEKNYKTVLVVCLADTADGFSRGLYLIRFVTGEFHFLILVNNRQGQGEFIYGINF